jgi:methionyl-tRNA synthetase
MSESNTFYLTTPIYYVNARPHIGHAYTTIVADAIARRKRSLGIDTWFLTGTDEHGQKIERSAQAAGCTPQEFADKVSAEFRGLWDRMGLTYDDYIRTTEPRHTQAVQKLFALLRDNGYIYKGSYTGQYCVFDEAYVDVPVGAPCPDCGRITETVNEENYYFKLSAFERRLLEYYDEHPEFIRPETRRNEVIAFVKSGLRDLSVSRTSFNWGIPVPGDEKHVIYVWLDALANYITALGWGSEDDQKYKKFWPAAAKIRTRPRLAAFRRKQDVEVARQHRAHGNHSRRLRGAEAGGFEIRTGPVRRRRTALLSAARNRLRLGWQFLLRRPGAAL